MAINLPPIKKPLSFSESGFFYLTVAYFASLISHFDGLRLCHFHECIGAVLQAAALITVVNMGVFAFADEDGVIFGLLDVGPGRRLGTGHAHDNDKGNQ
jgi:hypothetical protein